MGMVGGKSNRAVGRASEVTSVELQLRADVTDMTSDTDSPEDEGRLPRDTSFPGNLARDAMHRASS